MKMKNLDHINMGRIAKMLIFNTCDVRPEIEKQAEKGIRDTVRIATEMLSQEMLSHVISLDDAAESIGISAQDARRHIKKAIKVGRTNYDGKFGQPEILDPDQLVYQTIAYAIDEYGRTADDINEYVVKYYIGEYLDVTAIKTKHDMGCYVFLIDFFERYLNEKLEKTSFTKYLKGYIGPAVTSARLMSFMKKNDWYGNDDETFSKIGVRMSSPKLSDIINALIQNFEDVKELTLRQREQFELDQAFDNK